MKSNNSSLIFEGVVVLYNPDDSVVDNIETYLNNLRQLYVIDNSPSPNEGILDILRSNERIVLISNKNEGGIARALNIAADLALKAKAHWLLTMDQDSKFEKEGLDTLIKYVSDLTNESVSIVSPFHQTLPKQLPKNELPQDIIAVMTSGNLLNLRSYKIIGEFKEDFKIDYVDIEYCLRSSKLGYKIIRHNGVLLKHHLGNKRSHSLNIDVTHHNYIRRYYITKNSLTVIRDYFFNNFLYCIVILRFRISDTFKIIFFERDKMRKMKSIYYGLSDFIFGREARSLL